MRLALLLQHAYFLQQLNPLPLLILRVIDHPPIDLPDRLVHHLELPLFLGELLLEVDGLLAGFADAPVDGCVFGVQVVL